MNSVFNLLMKKSGFGNKSDDDDDGKIFTLQNMHVRVYELLLEIHSAESLLSLHDI